MTLRALSTKAIDIIMNREFIAKAIGSLLFFLVALFLFISLRFPTDELAPYVERKIQKSAEPFRVSISDLTSDFPFGFKATGVNVLKVKGEKSRPLFDIDILTVRPSLFSLLTGGVGGAGSIEFLDGTAEFDGKTDDDNNVSFQINFDEIEIGDVAALDDFTWAKLTGRLAGNGDVSIREGDISKGDGALEANLKNGTLRISKAIASGLKPAKIDSGEITATLTDGKLTVSRFIINGPQISLEGGGDIILNKSPGRSILKLKFSLSLSGELGKKLNPFLSTLKSGADGKKILKISGTIDRPKIS